MSVRESIVFGTPRRGVSQRRKVISRGGAAEAAMPRLMLRRKGRKSRFYKIKQAHIVCPFLFHVWLTYQLINMSTYQPVNFRKLVLQQIPANHNLLHFSGALVNLRDFRVAHQALYVEFFYIAIAAVDLHRFVGNPLGNFRSI